MSKRGRLLAGVFVVLLAASAVFAEEGRSKDSKQHVDKLSKELQLTDEQRGQVEQIMDEYRGRMETLKGQIEALKKEKQEKINAVLNATQQEKFNKMKNKKSRRGWLRRHSN